MKRSKYLLKNQLLVELQEFLVAAINSMSVALGMSTPQEIHVCILCEYNLFVEWEIYLGLTWAIYLGLTWAALIVI